MKPPFSACMFPLAANPLDLRTRGENPVAEYFGAFKMHSANLVCYLQDSQFKTSVTSAQPVM